jgi:hypothetical protein
MTIERPMFPPVEQSNVVQFSAIARKPRESSASIPETIADLIATRSPDKMKSRIAERIAERMARQAKRDAETPPSETCKNKRLRDQLWDAWRRARSTAEYWNARVAWNSALTCAQRESIGDSGSFPPASHDCHWELLAAWRNAIVQQLQTAAPDAASIIWKKTYLADGKLDYLKLEPNQLARIVAKDEAFIAAHPVRAKKGNKQ